MAEQRLIDANKLIEKCENLYMRGHVLFHGVTAFTIENAPTIDPETLPIVRQLREELARVTVERDAAVERVQHYAGCWECDVREKGNCATPFYKDNCDNWAWRGPQKEATP